MNKKGSSVTVIHLKNVNKEYRQAKEALKVLENLNLDLKQGECVALLGSSGSGKSTLLHIAGLLDHPSSGNLVIKGENCSTIDDKKRTSIRRNKVGFVYQFHHLLPEFTAVENVMIPQLIAGVKKKDAREKSKELLDKVGLSHRYKHRSSQLSGGEQQRVAIARALANDPEILLADEPTGNLDEETTKSVFDIFLNLVKESKLSALIATHNIELAKKMDRIFVIKDKKAEPYSVQ